MNTGNCTYDVCAYLNCVHFFCICVVKLNIFSKNKNFSSLCYNILYVLDFRIFNWCSKTCARDETMSFKPVMFICTYTYALKICYESRNSSTLNLIFSTLVLSYCLYFTHRNNIVIFQSVRLVCYHYLEEFWWRNYFHHRQMHMVDIFSVFVRFSQ